MLGKFFSSRSSVNSKFSPKLGPTLLIPTRNRPTSLNSVMHYVATFYPQTKVVIADASEKSFQELNANNVKNFKSKLSIDYRSFPGDLSFFDRMITVLNDLEDEYCVLGADDDYPIIDTLVEARQFLENHKGYSVCGGYNLLIKMNKDLEYTTRIFDAQTIEEDSPTRRCKVFAKHAFPTYYCVTSSEHLLSRYALCKKTCVVGFGDYMLGIHDVCRGKLKILPTLSYIRTSNPNHSYVRSTDRLMFLRNAESILALQEHMYNELMNADNVISETIIKRTTEDFIVNRIRYLIREKSTEASTPQIAETFNFHKELISPGSPENKKFQEKIDYIVIKLKEVFKSDDNKNESSYRTTLDSLT